MTKNNILGTLKSLSNKGIRLICIDFNNTFLTLDTNGRWDSDPIELSNYIRPIFIKFIRSCVKKKIHVAIVSFSPQENTIRSCLEHYFREIMGHIYIKTGNMNNKPNKTFCKLIKKKLILKRKVPMMLSICNDIYYRTGEIISPKQVLLIDDEWNNIKTAAKSGFKTYHFNQDSDIRMLADLRTIEHYSKPTTYTFIYADFCKLILLLSIIIFLFWKDRNTTIMDKRLVTVKV